MEDFDEVKYFKNFDKASALDYFLALKIDN